MRCPKCQFDHQSQTTECLQCGVVFSRYAPPPAPLSGGQAIAAPGDRHGARFPAFVMAAASRGPSVHGAALAELKYRAFALPAALAVAYFAAGSDLNIVGGMLAMVLHESGHAITSWLTGRWAVPMLWVTMHGEVRSWGIVLCLAACFLFGGFLAWKTQRWGWVSAAGAMLLLQIIVLSSPVPPGALIVFFGDGGALILASILMVMFYAPHQSKLLQSWGLRWGLLLIGALAFMCVFRLWTGPFENIPFGELEGINLSDPSLLTQMYGWSVPQLIDRYVLLGKLCLAVLAAIYIWGLIAAYADVWVSVDAKAAGNGAAS